MNTKILVIGACGQIGTELTAKLRLQLGKDAVIASDIKEGTDEFMNSGPFEFINAMDKGEILEAVEKHHITDVYLMSAMLSATAEKYPSKGWDLNMASLLNVLEIAKAKKIKKVFWPSSIAVFGPTTPKKDTPQTTIMEPSTVYGISKQAGERWCEYYFNNYGVDVRSLRYPGIISWKTNPGGGTTDYAIEIFHEALRHKKYCSFLSAETRLPMMYMDDAVEATIQIMNAPGSEIKIRSSYNIAAMSFTPEIISEKIKGYIPEFEISYKPDSRQSIASNWPQSIDDTEARKDWNWSHQFNLEKMVERMIYSLSNKYKLMEPELNY